MDRLRRVVAAPAFNLARFVRLNRAADVGHTRLDISDLTWCITAPALGQPGPQGGAMLDLGISFLASVARDPQALAIVDGELRLTYGAWLERISALVAGFDQLGLKPGDHLVTALQNRWEAATIHWACQLAGIIITPLNWRSTADELDYCLEDADAKAIVYEGVSAEAVSLSKQAQARPRIAVGVTSSQDIAFDSLVDKTAPPATARVDAEAWSV